MDYLIVASAALCAAVLTFFTGFGLGTLLLPVFALFVPVEQAVALTAVVHLVNGFFKLALVRRHVAWRIVVSFGIPAVAASLLGAWLLLRLAAAEPLLRYSIGAHVFAVTPAKLSIGILLGGFALAEIVPRLKALTFAPRHFVIGGILSGFFGGLSGMQGALRSAFLVRAGLTKEQFIGTGAAIACLIDASRLGVYWPAIRSAPLERGLLSVAVAAALVGAILGSLLLKKVAARSVEMLVAVLLFVVAAGLVSGAF
jgi:uncharacterized membrane protein YfcA